jgi:hypothetical protein
MTKTTAAGRLTKKRNTLSAPLDWLSARLSEIAPRVIDEAVAAMREIGPEDEAAAIQALDSFKSAIARVAALAKRRAETGVNRLVVGS